VCLVVGGVLETDITILYIGAEVVEKRHAGVCLGLCRDSRYQANAQCSEDEGTMSHAISPK
jgi:hypothetical protein